ncbi:MAG: rhomboid family intramembrane serine protease [Nanoarchaeota archaeon]
MQSEYINTEKNLKTIRSDTFLFFKLLFMLIFYILLLPFALLILLFGFLFGSIENSKLKFNRLVSKPFIIIKEIYDWFFEAKYTAFLMFILIVIFLLQYFVFNDYAKLFYTHPNDLFGVRIYTLLTSIFLHANIIHLGTNLLALMIFGRLVERDFQEKTILIFIVGGFLANIVSHIISIYYNDLFFSIGASGGIAALAMLAILLHPFALSSILVVPVPIFVYGWFLIFLDIIGLTNPSQTNHYAHIGGYCAILVLLFFIEFKKRKRIYIGLTLNIAMLLIYLFLLKDIIVL